MNELDDLRERIAKALGWTVQEVLGFSLQALRDLVRPVSPKLAAEITARVSSGRVVLGCAHLEGKGGAR